MRIRKSKQKLYSKYLGMTIEPFWTVRLFDAPLRIYVSCYGDIFYVELTPDFNPKTFQLKDDIIYLGAKEIEG